MWYKLKYTQTWINKGRNPTKYFWFCKKLTKICASTALCGTDFKTCVQHCCCGTLQLEELRNICIDNPNELCWSQGIHSDVTAQRQMNSSGSNNLNNLPSLAVSMISVRSSVFQFCVSCDLGFNSDPIGIMCTLVSWHTATAHVADGSSATACMTRWGFWKENQRFLNKRMYNI